MADTKKSDLPAATTPLAGTEIIDIVQGGVNKRATINDVLANDTDPVTSVNGLSGGAVTLTQDVVGDVATGTITNSGSTVLPTNTTLIGPWGYRTNNATALAVGLDVMSAYIETDY